MHTTHLLTTCALVAMPLDVSTGWEGGWVSLQVNKFEQVTSDCHQMSLGGGEGAGTGGSYVICLWEPGLQGVPGLMSGRMYSKGQYIMGNGHMSTPSHPPDRLTDIYRTENITFPQCRRWIVKMILHSLNST